MTATHLTGKSSGLEEKLLLYGNGVEEDHRSDEEKSMGGIVKLLSTFITGKTSFSTLFSVL